MFEDFRIIKQLRQLKNDHRNDEFLKELRSDLSDYIEIDMERADVQAMAMKEEKDHYGIWGRLLAFDRFRLIDRFRLWPRLAKVGVFSLAVVFLGGSVAMASQESLPGDALYPVKLLTEDVRFTLAVSNESKAKLHISFAAERVSEIKTILEKKGAKGEGLDTAMARLQYNASHAKEILDKEEKEGRNVSELAKEISNEFNDQKKDLQESYQSKENNLRSEEQDIKERIRGARKNDNGAELKTLNDDLDAVKDEKSDLVSQRNEIIKSIQDSKNEMRQKMQESERRKEDMKDLTEEMNKTLEEKNGMMEKIVQEKIGLNEEAFNVFDQLMLEAQKALQNDDQNKAQQLIGQAREDLASIENRIDNLSEDAGNEELRSEERSKEGSGSEGETINGGEADKETDRKEDSKDSKDSESSVMTKTRLG